MKEFKLIPLQRLNIIRNRNHLTLEMSIEFINYCVIIASNILEAYINEDGIDVSSSLQITLNIINSNMCIDLQST